MAQAEYVTSAIRVPITDAGRKPYTKPGRAPYVEFVTALAGHFPRAIPIYADAVDLEDRADHLNKVLAARSSYLSAILDDAAQNVPGGLDLRQIDALFSDLASHVRGILQRAVEGVAGRVA